MRRIKLPEELALPRVLDGPSALLLFTVSAALLALMPLDFSIARFAVRFFLAVAAFALVLAAAWLMLQAFKSRIAWSWFFAPVLANLALALGAALVLRALSVLMQAALGVSFLSHIVYSLTPILVLVTFAWTVEKTCQLPERQASFMGWLSVGGMAVGLWMVDWVAVSLAVFPF